MMVYYLIRGAEELYRHISMPIPRGQQNCLRLALRPPMKDGSPAYGQTPVFCRLYVAAQFQPCLRRYVILS